MELAPTTHFNPLPREDSIRSQMEADEELAFQETLRMIAQAEAKAWIAEKDEVSALELQEREVQGKQLYVKYPNLDIIKGDALFFPLKEALDKPLPLRPPVPTSPSTPSSSSIPSTPLPKGPGVRENAHSESGDLRHRLPHPSQPIEPPGDPFREPSRASSELRSALASAGITIKAASKPAPAEEKPRVSESVFSSPSVSIPASADVSTSSPREEHKISWLTRAADRAAEILHIKSEPSQVEGVSMLEPLLTASHITASQEKAPSPPRSYAGALNINAKPFVPSYAPPKQE
jgi:hypothetical protein